MRVHISELLPLVWTERDLVFLQRPGTFRKRSRLIATISFQQFVVSELGPM